MVGQGASAFGTVLMASLLLSSPASAQGTDPQAAKETGMTKIHVIVGGETLVATLDDTPVAQDFASLLPLDLSLSDYHATEKVADLPRKLDVSGAPASYTPKAGDITHFAPWGNLAIFYRPFQNSRGLVRLGEFDGPMDALMRDGAFPVRIELAE